MHTVKYPKWLNFLWFQCIWFVAILGREQTQWWLLALLLIHLALCKDWKTEIKLMLMCTSVGVALDSVFTWQGVFNFATPTTLLPIPFWLVAIWLGFSGTLRHSLSYLLPHPTLAMLGAGISAPLSYLAGMRLGAVEFGLNTWQTAVLIGAAWIFIMPVLIYFSNKASWTLRALPKTDVPVAEQIAE
jgi:hypothetical protein